MKNKIRNFVSKVLMGTKFYRLKKHYKYLNNACHLLINIFVSNYAT